VSELARDAARPPDFTQLAENCFAGPLDRAAALIVDRARSGTGGYVCLCNVHVLTTARRDTRLRTTLGNAWLRLPDGAPVAWLQRRIGRDDAERVGGPDVTARVLDLGRACDLRHFFLGSTPTVLANLERRVPELYPGVRIVGSLSPPFEPLSPSITQRILDALAETDPQIVWVGLGAPKQEAWMEALSARSPGVLFLGVGAAFDFLAGTTPRAPAWMRSSGLEWLYRLRLEPRRLVGRYVRTNTAFMVATGRELVARRLWR
jgi:N-acetylglucosaminyldiphosphoundecaprenol N-acetyl-beta-D-mannosaminyltransferase